MANSTGHRASATISLLSGAMPRWLSASGKATTAPTISSRATMPPTVKASDTVFSRMKLRFFTLLIGDVEGVEDGFDAGIGAPDREHESEEESDTKGRTAVRHDARHLVLDDLKRALGQHHRERMQVGTDRRGIGEQAIE